ncbi:MAG: putative transport system permease protein [Kosmotogales bacterium]|nr:putative transport system permease protein [Kosmotogales bacterium]
MFKKTTSILKKLIWRIISSNRSHNRYVIVAVALTTMLITAVFSIGLSYLKSTEVQQTRLMGTTAHIEVTNLTDKQVERLKTLPYVKTVGLQYNAGSIKNTPEMGNMCLSLYWYDRIEWKKFRVPAVTDIVGNYPEKYNEIMVPLWVLDNMGITNPEIGMKIPLSFYQDEGGRIPENENFILSGYCREYSHIRIGNMGTIYVSDEFAKESGSSVQNNGVASVSYVDDGNIDRNNERLAEDLSLTENQKIRGVTMYRKSGTEGILTLLALVAIVAFLMFTGYLLIYNVFYISVSRDIRFYGLLKTVGTSKNQLKKIVTGQAWKLAGVGIPIGLLTGAILSFLVVPMAFNIFDLKTGVEISFNPLIFIGAAFFALLTTMAGATKSAKTVAKISPVEALRFTGVRGRGKRKRSTNGGKPFRMAWRNIFRDPKRTFVVLLSLFLGITTFMMITALVFSLDTSNYIATYVKNDFTLVNNTIVSIGNGSEISEKQKFDSEFFERLEEIEGITDLRITSMEKIKMSYDPLQFSKHMDNFYRTFNIKEKFSDREIQDGFWGYIIGIDSRYVEEFNEDNEKQIDIEAFRRGDIALIGTNNPDLYSDVHEMNVKILSSDTDLQIDLGGFVPFGFQFAGGSTAPNIYVSEKALAKMMPDPKIYRINMDVEDGLEERALEEIKILTYGDYEITITSELEKRRMLHDTKLIMYILGGGVALILALIGILNFVNVMATGVMARKLEFAMLESVGMTKRQIRRMLVLEGLGYACITTFLVGTLGSMMTYFMFEMFQQQADYAIFTFPLIQMLILIIVVFAVCIFTPGKVYGSSNRTSIVERLRESE